MSFNLISSILKGQWFLEGEWAKAHYPFAIGMLKGNKEAASVFRSGNESVEHPFVINENGEKGHFFHYSTWGGANRTITSSEITPNSVAVIPISGPITKYNGDCGAFGAMQLSSFISMAVDNANISAILLDIDSPGGEGTGATALANAVRVAKQSKPVMAYIADGGAYSAAYWIASQANAIYTRTEHDGIGSIGGFITLASFEKYYEKEGIDVRQIYAPQSTNKNIEYRNVFDAENPDVSLIESHLATFVDVFINDVKSGRGNKLTADTSWNTGATYFAKDALRLGLIDGYKSFDEVINEVRKEAALPAYKKVNKKSDNKMSSNTSTQYPAIATTVGWGAQHESTEEGIFLQHDEAATINTALESATEQANATSRLAELQTKFDAQALELAQQKESNTALQSANDSLTVKNEELTAQLAAPANAGTHIATDNNDDAPGDEGRQAKALHPFTAQAMNIVKQRKK